MLQTFSQLTRFGLGDLTSLPEHSPLLPLNPGINPWGVALFTTMTTATVVTIVKDRQATSLYCQPTLERAEASSRSVNVGQQVIAICNTHSNNAMVGRMSTEEPQGHLLCGAGKTPHDLWRWTAFEVPKVPRSDSDRC